MTKYRRALWLYPLFQIPAMLLVGCLIMAVLFWLLGLGRPNVSVAIALDLSNSTYENQAFNAPGSIMAAQIDAVRNYLNENTTLRNPNQVQVFGFGNQVIPLTGSFQGDSNQVIAELDQTLSSPGTGQQVDPNGTDVNAALRESQNALNQTANQCKEVLLVTDGTGDTVEQDLIQAALNDNIKINVLVVAENITQELRNIGLAQAALQTGGIFIPGSASNLSFLFIDEFFNNFNSNLRWLIFWVGLAWIALMWAMVMPLDKWILQGVFKLPMHLAGQIAIFNAVFWTATTPGIIWRLASGLPFLTSC